MPKKTSKKKQQEKSIVVRTPQRTQEVTLPSNYGLRNELNKWFDDMRDQMEERFLNPWLPSSALVDVRVPSMDIMDKGNEFIIHADMPGIDKDKIEINVTSSHIEISGETGNSDESNEHGYVTQERNYSQFYRSSSLPADVIPEKAEAKINNGVLEIRLPKKTPTPVTKKHKVQVK
jgi:HSP20 family molecular chaperone IbpA